MADLARNRPDAVDAAWLVAEILRTHPRYAQGRAPLILEQVQPPPGLRRQSVPDWFAEARTVLNAELGELSGRLVIVALALCEPALGRELVRTGLFHAILQDTEEGHGLLGSVGSLLPGEGPAGARRVAGHAPRADRAGGHGLPGKARRTLPHGTRAIGYAEEGEPREVALWHVESGRLIARLHPPVGVRMARFTADGRHVRALLRDGRIGQWTVNDAERNGFEELTDPIPGTVSGALSGDATAACVRLRTPEVVLIDPESGALTSWATRSPATRICMSADGSRFAVAFGSEGSVQSWSAGNVGEPETFDLDAPIEALECTPTQAIVLARSALYSIRDTPVLLDRLSCVRRVAVAPDGSVVACSGPDSVSLYQPQSAVHLGALGDEGPPAIRASFSLHGRRLVTCHTDDSMRVWDVGLQPSTSRIPPAAFHSDNADEGGDLLGRNRDVNAFASLIAAKSVTPPLSIGIFANWGGGKSWFMQQLRRQVAALAADARESQLPQSEVSFYQKIAQVQFNAWHYSETDIMASLVDHILTRLEVGEPVDAYTTKLREARKTVAAADNEVRRTESDLQKAETELGLREADRVVQEHQRNVAAEKLRAQLSTDAALAGARSQAAAALAGVGWEMVPGAVEDLTVALREARAELLTGRGLLTPLVVGTTSGIGSPLGSCSLRRSSRGRSLLLSSVSSWASLAMTPVPSSPGWEPWSPGRRRRSRRPSGVMRPGSRSVSTY